MSDPEVLIIGGGVAGSAAAIALARAGRQVRLVEREAGPHDKVCGEFISPEGVEALKRLGLDPFALGGRPVDRVRFEAGSRTAETALGFRAASLSRWRLDSELLSLAETAGAEVRRGVRIVDLVKGAEGWIARTAEGEKVAAKAAFLAVGKHELRGWRRPPGLQNDLIGFKMHWRLRPEARAALGGAVELFLFPGGYGGLEPIEGGLANLCLLVRKSRLSQGGWDRLLAEIRQACPALDARLIGGEPCWAKPLAVAGLPYGHRAKPSADGLWRLGDQAAVIPSFAGEGMSIALLSARLAAEAYLADEAPAAASRRLSAAVGRQLVLASFVSLALTHPVGQAAAARFVIAAPRLMRWMAKATRLKA